MTNDSAPASSTTNPMLAKLRRDAALGNADAEFALAMTYLQGSVVPRDLAKSRQHFDRAAALGHHDGQRIAICWKAGGTGGPQAWTEAVEAARQFGDHDPYFRSGAKLLDAMDLDEQGYPTAATEGQLVSEKPYVEQFPSFATEQECNHLIALARPLLRRALVGNPGASGLGYSAVRTCESMGFPLLLESPFIHAINRRIARASGTDVLQGEPTQIFRYMPGQEFKPHTDSSPDFPNQRVATFLIYLNDEYEGGETHFLHNDLKVRGKRGDAVLFRNVDPNGATDPTTKHAGLPVRAGEKWLLSRWIRKDRLTY